MHYKEKIKHIKIEDQPLVSVITPLYNAASYIAKSIQSVREQTYSNWEHIIVDDYSTDDSVLITEKLARSDERIYFVANKTNQGAAKSRNWATQLAKGKYIAFLDADDLWHPEKLMKQIRVMEKNTCDVCLTNYLQIDEEGNPLHKRIKALPILSYKKQHNNNYVGNLTGIYNASTLGKIIAPNIRKRQDWAVWLEALKISEKPAIGIQEDLAYYRVHDGSMSSSKLHLIRYNYLFYRSYLGYSKWKSIKSLIRFFWEYFVVRPKNIEKY